MYIAPKGIIKLLQNVPLDTTYEHTILFDNATHQRQYFESFCPTGFSLNEQSYTRVQRGKIRVAIRAERLYRFNYLMFQNNIFNESSSIGTGKWFYAFIKSVEYINNEVTEIAFEIDVMQTWHFTYTLKECFVEREHSATDNFYEHTLDENLDIGDTYFQINNTDTTSGLNVIGNITPESTSTNVLGLFMLVNKKHHFNDPDDGWIERVSPGKTIGNVYNGLGLYYLGQPSDPDSLDSFLNAFYENEIVGLYEAPICFRHPTQTSGNVPTVSFTKQVSNPAISTTGALLNHVVRNRKLFCSPFTKIIATNNLGTTCEYKWENWSNGARGNFKLQGMYATSGNMIIYPTSYNQVPDNVLEGLTYSSFPNCAWSGDAFKAWWAQNKSSFVSSTLSGVLSSAGSGATSALMAGMATGNPVIGLAAGFVSTVANSSQAIRTSMAKYQDMKNAPNQSHGHSQNDLLNPATNRVKFDFYNVTLKPEYLDIIDDYFDRFGYACKKNKVPNRDVRPFWCYTKTANCTIDGSIPADDANKICGIYNNGITFWKAKTTQSGVVCNVGDYTQVNTLAATNTPN